MNTNAKETLLFHCEKEMKKKDRFVKFHPSSKQMILFISALDPFVGVAIGYSWFDGLLRNPWSGVQNPSGARVQ
jgi:hypothetical protein